MRHAVSWRLEYKVSDILSKSDLPGLISVGWEAGGGIMGVGRSARKAWGRRAFRNRVIAVASGRGLWFNQGIPFW